MCKNVTNEFILGTATHVAEHNRDAERVQQFCLSEAGNAAAGFQ